MEVIDVCHSNTYWFFFLVLFLFSSALFFVFHFFLRRRSAHRSCALSKKKKPETTRKMKHILAFIQILYNFFLGVVNVERFCSDTWASVLTMPSALLYYQFNFLVKYFYSFPPVLFTSRILSILLYEPTKKTEFTNSSSKRKFSIEIINRRKKLHFGREFSCVYCVIKHRIITSVMCTNDPMPFIISVNTKIQNNTTKYSTNKLNSSITFSLVFVVLSDLAFGEKYSKAEILRALVFFFISFTIWQVPFAIGKFPSV